MNKKIGDIIMKQIIQKVVNSIRKFNKKNYREITIVIALITFAISI